MDKFIESRPQRLCLMCGKCCRVATTPKSYEELLELANNGDESAKEFLEIFEPYPSVEAARTVCSKTVDNVLKQLVDMVGSPQKITFYKCRHIGDDNLCGIYQNRFEVCQRFPSSPWAVIPPGCGYEGWLFQKREELKQKIRRQKEFLIELEIELKRVKDPEMIKKVEEAIAKTKNIIDAFAQYGSHDW